MALHHTNELTFALPDGLRDCTHHVFTLRDDGPSEFTLVMKRQPVRAGDTFATFEAALLPELERALPEFELLEKSHCQVAETLALVLEYRWTQQGQRLHVLQAHLLLPAAGAQAAAPGAAGDAPAAAPPATGERGLLMISGTALDVMTERWERAFYDMLASARLRHAGDHGDAAGVAPDSADAPGASSSRSLDALDTLDG